MNNAIRETQYNIKHDIDDKDKKDDSLPEIEKINITNILFKSIFNNKMIFVATIPLFIGYYLQDTIFTRSIAKITTDIPGFLKTVDGWKLGMLLLPYVSAILLFYMSKIITSITINKIELTTIKDLTEKMIESIKTSKTAINVNDVILHIKKLGDTKNIYGIIVTHIVPTLIVSIGLVYNFICGDSNYAIIVALLLIVLGIITIQLEISSVKHAFNTENAGNDLFDSIHEVMLNMDSVITSNTQKKEMNNINVAKEELYKYSCKSNVNNNTTTYGLQAFSVILVLGINYLAYKLYNTNKIDSAQLTATVLMSLLLMDYYNFCIGAIAELVNNMGRYYEIKDYFSQFKIVTYPNDVETRKLNLMVTDGTINISNLTLRYENKNIFENLNLTIRGNTITGMIGPIGSGKTTLLKTFAGIVDYTGNVLIDDQRLENCTYESIAENIAYIPQHPKLFNKTIYYNINYGSAYSKENILKKIESYGLKDFINSFPDKLETNVGKEGNKVSGGQRQLIAIIRALIQNKKILLLDEPTSSLDIKNKDIFLNLIKNIKHKTIIISTHDKQLMQVFDTVIDVGKFKNKS